MGYVAAVWIFMAFCVAVNEAALGATCRYDTNCEDVGNSTCSRPYSSCALGVCMCMPGYGQDDGDCIPARDLGDACTSDAECQLVTQGSECDDTDNECVCPTDAGENKVVGGTKYCYKALLADSCTTDADCLAYIIDSSSAECNTNCQCVTGYKAVGSDACVQATYEEDCNPETCNSDLGLAACADAEATCACADSTTWNANLGLCKHNDATILSEGGDCDVSHAAGNSGEAVCRSEHVCAACPGDTTTQCQVPASEDSAQLLNLGDLCSSDSDCLIDDAFCEKLVTSCSKGVCSCKDGYSHSNKFECFETADIGDDCDSDTDCVYAAMGATCSGVEGDDTRVCECEGEGVSDLSVEVEDGETMKICAKSRMREACDANSDCLAYKIIPTAAVCDTTCQCKAGWLERGEFCSRAPYGNPCATDDECLTEVCTDERCGCSTGYTYSMDWDVCVREGYITRSAGESCETDYRATEAELCDVGLVCAVCPEDTTETYKCQQLPSDAGSSFTSHTALLLTTTALFLTALV